MTEPKPVTCRRKPHQCNEACVCPVHGTDLIYSDATDDHACQDVSCEYGHGGAAGALPFPGRYRAADREVDRHREPRDYLSPGFPDRYRAWTIQEMRRNGWSIEGLARVFGLTPFGVELYLRKETRA
jgi:hypothetical protein